MKTLVCLVRHGETDWNKLHLIQGRIDISLNEQGRKQINQTGINILKLGIDWNTYLSSPLKRALESCEIIRHVLNDDNKPIIICPNLIEREFGKADGTIIDSEVYKKVKANEIEGMEKSFEIQSRAINELYRIVQKYKGQNILIVTHSHFIKAIFTVLDQSLQFDAILKNGGLNFIEFEDNKIKRFAFNK